jgi:CheY-like chemotaxis protein
VFTVKLPLVAAPALANKPEVTSPGASSHARRVLVVEDNPDLAGSMVRLLELEGHDARAAHTGARAIEVARSFRPEIVLCDIGLPGGMNGYDVAQALRRDPAHASIFLIALTGYGRPEDHRLVIGAGFDMHMIKPVDPVLLSRVLARPREVAVGDSGPMA